MIIIVAGSKGGVGKSIVSLAAYHYLTKVKGKYPLVIDADTSNPDVYKAVASSDKKAKVQSIEIDTADGWITIVNEIGDAKASDVILNTPARCNEALISHGAMLESVLEELDQTLLTLWPITRQRDSLELLKEYLDAFPARQVHVIKNGFFGPEGKFDRYEKSKLKETVEGRGGKNVWIDDLADRVVDEVYSARLTFEKANETMPIGNRAELGRWLKQAMSVMESIL